ncbi:MAG: RecQ family ATP-dependent DNA helicase [Anaerolineae bacterium]
MTTTQQTMSDDVLEQLRLAPGEVPTLPARARNSLLTYLQRWEEYAAARDCLEALAGPDEQRVTILDRLARAYLGTGQAQRAAETMRRRNELRQYTGSLILEGQALLAAGDLAGARAIAGELLGEDPPALGAWDLEAEIRLAEGDPDGAGKALAHRERQEPETAGTALGLARVWQARGDDEKALLWARTALSRTEGAERTPGVELLRLLEALYRATGQAAQAAATSARLEERRQEEWAALREEIGLSLPSAPMPAAAEAAPEPSPEPVQIEPGEQARLTEALHRYFEHRAFRPGQAETIAAVQRGESVLAVMPTGAGKSLCYQLAALLLPGTTLVISPLIALMKDQLDGLPAEVMAQATQLNHTLDGSELAARLARVAAGDCRLVYAAPERLRQRPFLHALKQAGISMLVIDEAHCVSLWGHDFRPDYRFIVRAWHELGQPRILAMTATATPRVRDDVRAALGSMRLVATDVHRPNLRLEARAFANEAEKREALVDLCRQIEGSGIVYATSRRKCENLAALLRQSGVQAMHYHAGIADRAAAQDRFMSGQVRVVVATIAFGMGIDNADVRFIIHYNPPKALENYYQEAGRAGRDGLPARCILFHASSDWANLTRWTRASVLEVEFLRQVYAAVQRRLAGQEAGLVAGRDLERDLGTDETQVRVAIHFLEMAGLLWRGFDLPRTASLGLRIDPARLAGDDGQALARFAEAARLRPGQTVSRNLVMLGEEAGAGDGTLADLLDPREVEARLLGWDDAGWLEYRGIGRDMLLALPPAPADSRQRVAAMLADYQAGQEARVAEIKGYAHTRVCRHGYISAYFGGRPIEQCQVCDNCDMARTGRPAAPAPVAAVPARAGRKAPPWQGDPAGAILQAMRDLPYALGRSGLAKALQGSRSSAVKGDRFRLFGTLAGTTQARILEMTDELLRQGLLEQYKERNYPLLRLSARGKEWLKENPPRTQTLAEPLLAPERGDEPAVYDQELYERLAAWRTETARAMGKPPYVVLNNKTLKAIAAGRPSSLEEVAAIKGIGPAKLERYGQAVLDLVAGREPPPPDQE